MAASIFPGIAQRRLTGPRVVSGNPTNSWDKIEGDSGQVSADSPEQRLKIVGSGGITVSCAEGTPDTITIDGSGVQGAEWHEDEFAPTAGQISFVLSSAPSDPDSVFVFVNGVVYDDSDDFTVSGQTVTWSNTLFLMELGDEVIIKYV